MALFRDRALLLKRYPYGESSLVVHLCTREHGRVHVLARGAYRPTSRYFAILDLFDELELEWSAHPGRELADLRAGSILRRRRRPSADLGRYRAAVSVLELAELASRPGEADRALYDLVDGALSALDAGGLAGDRGLVVFELRFLQTLGLHPALDRCAACAGAAEPVTADRRRVAFSAGAGGRLCRACAVEARASGRRVGTMPLQVLEDGSRLLALDEGARAAFLAGLAQARVDRIRDFTGRFLDYHLESQPRTHRAFLAVANRNAPDKAAEAL